MKTPKDKERKMNKSEAIDVISHGTGVSKADTERVIAAFFELASKQVGSGEKLTIPGWISFERVHRPARQGRNPQTGESLTIPARNAVKVSAGSKLKSAAN